MSMALVRECRREQMCEIVHLNASGPDCASSGHCALLLCLCKWVRQRVSHACWRDFVNMRIRQDVQFFLAKALLSEL